MSSSSDISTADVPNKCPSVAEMFKILDQVTSNKKPIFPPIGKAPFMLRADSKVKYFEPRAVALGPVHHDNPKYHLAEEFKMILTAKFIRDIDCPRETLFETIKSKIDKWKSCYEEEVRNNYADEEKDDKLACILLLDGCAVLQFIQSAVDDTLKEMVKNNLSAFAVHDLFLLENQLPFELLEDMMSHRKDGKEKFLKAIRAFIDFDIGIISNKEWEIPSGTHHLLHLLRARMLVRPQKTQKPKKGDQGRLCFCFPKRSGRDPSHPTGSSSHTNDCLSDHTSIPMPANQQLKETDNQGASHQNGSQIRRHTFRNIMELKAAGIKVKRSQTHCLRDFNYEEGKLWYGTMKMPCIRVDDSTVPKFLNMIAYEMHPDFENDGEVSSYICLMDIFIDDADDVKELRKAKILHNMLGSDKEVADVFNTISTDLVPNPEYRDFLNKIQNHYDSEWKTSVAQMFHEHFNTPWTRIAFAGAVVGLILSFIQALSGFLN